MFKYANYINSKMTDIVTFKKKRTARMRRTNKHEILEGTEGKKMLVHKATEWKIDTSCVRGIEEVFVFF